LLAGPNGQTGSGGLKPEKSTQWTLGFRFEPIQSVSFGADLWSVQIKDQVLSQGIAEQVAFANPQQYQYLFINPYADPAGFTTIINDNWRDTQEAEIIATGLAPTNDLESAIVVTLAPGQYTAIVKGKNNTSGVALVEVYDLAQGAASKLANISTRAFVSTGTNIVIAGFILGNGTGNTAPKGHSR